MKREKEKEIDDLYFCEEKLYERLKADYKKHGSIVVACDFDNTLFDLHNLGASFEKVKTLMRECNELGFKVFIYSASCAERFPKILDFCAQEKIKVEGINEDVAGLFRKYPDRDYSKSKLYYNILLCDRAGLPSAYKTLRRLVDEIKGKDDDSFYSQADSCLDASREELDSRTKMVKVGDFILVGRRKGVVEEVYKDGQISYLAHNGIKIRNHLCYVTEISRFLSKEEFANYIKKSGNTSLLKYIN
jgi:hypothetical protein